MRGFVQREDDVRKANDLFATSLEKMRKDESMSMFFDVIKDSGGSFQETPRQTFCSGVKSVSVFLEREPPGTIRSKRLSKHSVMRLKRLLMYRKFNTPVYLKVNLNSIVEKQQSMSKMLQGKQFCVHC